MLCCLHGISSPQSRDSLPIVSNVFWDHWQTEKAEEGIKVYPFQSLHYDCPSHGFMIFAFTRLHKPHRVGPDQHQRPRITHETVEITAQIHRAAFLLTEKGVSYCHDTLTDMIVLGECEAWRGEKIKKLRSSFTVIIKLTGS